MISVGLEVSYFWYFHSYNFMFLFQCGLDSITTAHALVYFDKLTLMV